MNILEVKNLVKDFGGLRAVDTLSISIEEGQILGLIGPNGAGKSTAFNCIAGVYTPTEGEIFFAGEKINRNKPWDLCKKAWPEPSRLSNPSLQKAYFIMLWLGALLRRTRLP